MATFKVDELTNDFVTVSNRVVLIKGADEVTQRVRARLRMFRGEWFLNVTKGTPYRETIFAKGVSLDAISQAVKREILTVPGVQELLEYNQTLEGVTRMLTVNFQLLSTDGEILEFSEALPQ